VSEKQPWYVAERALALASLLLTSRSDVVLHRVSGDESDLDVLAEVLKDHVRAGRFFGVYVDGRLELPTGEAIDQDPRSARRKQLSEFTIPVCRFCLDVRRNQGLYHWLVEPRVAEHAPKLQVTGDRKWSILDERAVARIVERVAAWYDALAAELRA
jgi:hypothetical protein